jgi:hypothetical protein
MRKIWNFITSHYLCVYTGIAFIGGGLFLSFRLNGDGAYFEKIDYGILIAWLAEKGRGPLTISSFAFLLIILLTAVLFLNALLCTVRKVYHLVSEGGAWRRYLPHVMHAAFLVVVTGHLISSVSGDRVRSIPVFEGSFARVMGTPYNLKLHEIDLKLSDRGYPADFSADITLLKGTEAVSAGTVKINHPLIYGGYGVYIKNVGMDRLGRRYVFFDANRDDGATIVLAGALLFTLANVLYILPQRRKRMEDDGEAN